MRLLVRPKCLFVWILLAAAVYAASEQVSPESVDPHDGSIAMNDPTPQTGTAQVTAGVDAASTKPQSGAVPKYEPPPESRQFDFWIGEWNVIAPTGAPAGTSRIEKILDGCALLENWTGAGGNSGKSFNLYDRKKKEWRQHWIDDSGQETFYAGSFVDKCMSLTSEEQLAEGKLKLHRMRFFDLGAEGVRQWGEASDDGGANWTTEFDLLYQYK